MLDVFIIFSTSGRVLWQSKDASAKQIQGTPVNDLIRQALIEKRVTAGDIFVSGQYAVEYSMHNDLDFVCAAVYRASLKRELTYIGGLCADIRTAFGNKFGTALQTHPFQAYDFDDEFASTRERREKVARREMLEGTKKKQMKSFEQTKKFEKTLQHNEELQSGKLKERKRADAAAAEAEAAADSYDGNDGETEAERRERKRLEFINRQKSGGSKGKAPGPMKKSPKAKRKDKNSGKPTLDYSDPVDATAAAAARAAQAEEDAGSAVTAVDGQEIGEMEGEEIEIPADAAAAKDGKRGFFSMFSSLSGGTTITRETLAPVLLQTRDHLITKNVGADIAERICDGVGESLVGKSKSTFSRIAGVVKESIETTLTNILMPKRRVNILRDVSAKKKQRTPYVICFCGVNGVGKSTNLAKICYWLLQNENRVLIAACDTFRAGAVEQLRTHVRKLTAAQESTGKVADVKLYEKGYGKDPAGIAQEAIGFAAETGFDVVLVDTAGRMQDNEPLMRALSKLVNVNQPDLTLFVGEALVGNEAVDQLCKFNKALADHSASETPRGIDGIVLSKFDTVDDKVGAAISMTYITGQPIVFVGTGQTYSDLKKLNVKSVVASLLR